MRHLYLLLSLTLLGSLPMLSADAQEAEAEVLAGPEAIVQEFLDTVASDGLGATGRFFDPTALEEVKEVFLSLLELEAEQGEENLRGLFFDSGESLEEIRTFAPVEFYQGLMGFLELQVGQTEISLAGGEILGTVMEGDALAHVVTRFQMGFGDSPVASMDVVSLRKTEKGWAMLLKGEMLQMVGAIRAQVESARAAEAAEAAASEEEGEEGAEEP